MSERRHGEIVQLQPPEAIKTLEELRLTTGKAAEFCGVSRRQLCYWTDTGIIAGTEPEEGDEPEAFEERDGLRRLYDFPALHKVLLIKDTLDHGPGLRRAAREVDRYLTDRKQQREELLASFPQKREGFLQQQADRLDALAARVKEVLPRLKSPPSRKGLLALHRALAPLQLLQERVATGEALLEEDQNACMALEDSLDQLEARLEAVRPSP